MFDDPLTGEGTSFRWKFSLTPSPSEIELLQSNSWSTFTPDVAGEYWADRYVVLGVAENLSHRFVASVVAAPTMAVVMPDYITVAPGTVVMLDASASRSGSGQPLSYLWESLSTRPIPELPATTPMVSMTLTTRGTYRVRVTVQDQTTSASALAMINVVE